VEFDLSIVTGTYNRKRYLELMMNSARRSLSAAEGLRYEFVVVDGGSTDGTLEWLRREPGVRLIEHGTLHGAVRAFNDGALAARGWYVVLANDDVEFLGDGLLWAWSYMEAHPECGMGCFYQDRSLPGQPPAPWHVELMPCNQNGSQVHLPYGQVCIVAKGLGDRCGWWGDYLHTYGGDNEISAQVYESGYAVAPLYRGGKPSAPSVVPELADVCAIHDNAPDDALRRINNIDGAQDPRAVRGHHPDSWAWGRKWRKHDGRRWLVGPDVKATPQFTFKRGEGRDRFVYLPIYEQGWAVQKEQKRGLREALARVGVVVEVDYVGVAASGGKDALLRELGAALAAARPTVVLAQLHGPDPLGAGDVGALRARAPGAWWVNWNGDYWPENLLSEGGVALARAFDLQLTVNREALRRYREAAVQAGYWQIGWEPDGRGHEPDDRCDVVFLANAYSRERRELVKKLRALPHEFHLWGQGWPDGWARGQCLYDFVTACRKYRGARFSIGDSQWPESGFVSNRVMQALAAGGSALCHQRFAGMEELGLVDGETLIAWRSFDELREKLAWYGQNEAARAQIAAAGEALAVERHSFDRRVQELLAMRPAREMEDWR
jgi:glycosyltransferase involved in cell wall biosynthesis